LFVSASANSDVQVTINKTINNLLFGETMLSKLLVERHKSRVLNGIK